MSRIKTRAVTAALAAVALAVGMSACSSTPSAGKSSISVMTWGTAEDIKSIKDAAAGFSKENPNVTVKFLTGDCAVSYPACKQLIAGGNMPDVVVPGSWDYNVMVKAGILSDLTGAVKKAGVSTSDFTPAALDVAKSAIDGKLHALPMGYNIQSLFFNEDMFDKAKLGYPDPKGNYSWDDIRSWAKKLTLDTKGNNAESPQFDPTKIVQYGMHFGVTDQWPNIVARSFGGAVLGGKLYDKCGLEDPATITALQFVQDMMFKDHTAITQQQNTEHPGYQRWVTGSVAMEIGSHEQVGLAHAQNPSMHFDIAAAPKGTAGQVTMLQEHLWSAYAGSKNLPDAEKFVLYMATKGAGKQMGLIPAYKDLAQTHFASEPGEPKHIVEGQLEPAKWTSLFANIDPQGIRDAVSGQDGYGQVLTNIFTGAKPAADAVKGACAKVDKIINASK